CVLITTYIDNELRAQAEAIGIEQVFEKPVNVQQLLDCVEGLVATRPQPTSVNTNPLPPP
ncbi:MAG: hypothetical protein WBN92_09245, partial [Terriglobia bacterium]